MATTSIDLKIISCKDLKCFNFFQKLSVYAVIAIGNGDCDKAQRQQVQKTPIDREGNRNPEWNHEIRFDLEQIPVPQRNLLFLEFDLLSDGIFVDKLVGEVRVPITDLVEDSNGSLRFVNYQIQNTDGKPNGVLNFCYKVNLKGKIASYPTVDTTPPTVYFPAQKPAPVPVGYFAPPPQVSYYPPPAPLGFATPPPDPYGFRPGGYTYNPYGFPTVEYPKVEQSRPYEDDMWRKGLGWATDGSRGY